MDGPSKGSMGGGQQKSYIILITINVQTVQYTLLVKKSRKTKTLISMNGPLCTYLGMIAVGKERRPLLKPWLTSYFAGSVHCHLEKSVFPVKFFSKRLFDFFKSEILRKLLHLDKMKYF